MIREREEAEPAAISSEQSHNSHVTDIESKHYYESLLNDIYTMMHFARGAGIEIPDMLRCEIAQLISLDNRENRNQRRSPVKGEGEG